LVLCRLGETEAEKCMTKFPKMIYRPRDEPNSDLGGLKLDSLIVNSVAEQETAIGKGWRVELADAVARLEATEKRDARIRGIRGWYERWEWSFKAVAVLLGIVAGTIALIKVL
jgi:hypothetical protein